MDTGNECFKPYNVLLKLFKLFLKCMIFKHCYQLINIMLQWKLYDLFLFTAMMPLWIFTLGQVIFQQDKLGVPYDRIAMFASGLVIPLALGFFIQKYLPRVTKIMVRILKPFSALLILFIVIFAIVTNLYLFELFTWKVRCAYRRYVRH